MFGLKPSDIQNMIEVLKRYPQIEEALIFGSRAMGNYKPGSDVDLALKGNVDTHTAINVSIAFNEYLPLPYKFDVVAYPTLTNQALIDHIDFYGKVLYRRS